MSYLPVRPVNTPTESQQQLAVLQSVTGNQTDQLCSICGEDMGDSHACLHDIPASLLTLQDPRIGERQFRSTSLPFCERKEPLKLLLGLIIPTLCAQSI